MEKQKTILHFVRHGEVENPSAVRYGRLPGYHLSLTGRQQVEALSLFFAKRKIRHIYSSPLERTQQTATILGLAFPHISITLDDRIIEVKTAAKYEGKSRDIAFIFPQKPTTEAETQTQIINRFQLFIEEKVIAYNGREIIAISHGDPIILTYNKLVYNCVSLTKGIYPPYASIYSFVFFGLNLKQVWLHTAADAIKPAL